MIRFEYLLAATPRMQKIPSLNDQVMVGTVREKQQAGTKREHVGMIRLKRMYEDQAADDRYRVLFERLCQGKISIKRGKVDLWVRDAGTGTVLQKWYGHGSGERWEKFPERYFQKLLKRPDVVSQYVEVVCQHPALPFLFSARDERNNNAVSLKHYFEIRERSI